MALFLIADDSSFCRTMARMPLERAGHEVIEACDGEEALMLARLHDPDVIITGTHLPAIDTTELVARLRVEGFRPGVLLMASDPDAPEGVRAARTLNASVIGRPPVAAQLLVALRAMPQRRAAA